MEHLPLVHLVHPNCQTKRLARPRCSGLIKAGGRNSDQMFLLMSPPLSHPNATYAQLQVPLISRCRLPLSWGNVPFKPSNKRYPTRNKPTNLVSPPRSGEFAPSSRARRARLAHVLEGPPRLAGLALPGPGTDHRGAGDHLSKKQHPPGSTCEQFSPHSRRIQGVREREMEAREKAQLFGEPKKKGL